MVIKENGNEYLHKLHVIEMTGATFLDSYIRLPISGVHHWRLGTNSVNTNTRGTHVSSEESQMLLARLRRSCPTIGHKCLPV